MAWSRDLFLALSTNRLVQKLVIGFPLSRRISRRYVAGETLDEAMAVVEKLTAQNLLVTLDQLGESVTQEREARVAKDGYLHALDTLAEKKLASHVSVKLTQMGLDLSPDLCLDHMRQIIRRAKEIGALVTIDMEDAAHTQVILGVFETLRAEFDNVGIVIQSYLYRSEKDMRELLVMDAHVRLCKGAYKESAEVAFPLKKDVDANYRKLTELYLPIQGNTHGAYLALATHDEKIINWAKDYTTRNHIPRDHFEFQMLYGIRSDLQHQLAHEGYTMRVYVPYGSHWYPYLMRRLAERPANAIFFLSNLFK